MILVYSEVIMAWSRTSRHARGYGKEHEAKRKALLAREPLCRECRKHGRVEVARIADHIIPKADGGTDDDENYQPLCQSCSDEKTARESARAQGRTYRPRVTIGVDGWPVQR